MADVAIELRASGIGLKNWLRGSWAALLIAALMVAFNRTAGTIVHHYAAVHLSRRLMNMTRLLRGADL